MESDAVNNMDLVDSEDISESAILAELRRRFMIDRIYSSIGPIIIALNPYKNIPDLYSHVNMIKYLSCDVSLGDSASPHVWTISQAAFSSLKSLRTRQAIVISGESGGYILYIFSYDQI
jgi:myosin heavy subunit